MFRWKDKKVSSGLERAKVFRNTFAYVALFAALGAMVFFGVCTPNQQSNMGLKGPAAKVGGEEISSLEFRRAYENTRARYQQVYQDNFDPGALQLAKMVLDNLVEQRIAYMQASHLGVSISDAEIEKQIIEIFKDPKTGKFSAEQFNNGLKANGFSEASLMDQMRRDLTVNRFREFVGQTFFVSGKATEFDYQLSESKFDVSFIKLEDSNVQVSVSDADVTAFLDDAGKTKVKDYFDKNQTEFNKPGKVKARHILVAFQGAKRATQEAEKRSKDAAKKRAEDLLAQVKAPGANFAAIATKETDETSGKAKGGDLGFFTREDMAKEFSDAAFAMKAGEISNVVESPFGFHVIKVEAVQPEIKKSLADATNDIARKLLEKEKKPKELENLANTILADLKQGKSINELLKKHNLEWKDTGSFAANATSLPKLGANRAVIDAVFTLKKPGDIFPTAVEAERAKYILKLKTRSDANLASLDNAKKEELAKNAALSEGSSLFNSLKDKAQKKMQDKGEIKLNEDYLAIDQRGKNEGS
jgi:peptidyl-prolyl cis-trans isomerase D